MLTSNESPVFIVGSPRTGSTLLRLMLTSHKSIVIPPESGFLVWWYDKYKDWKPSDNSSGRLPTFLKDLFTSKKIETWNISRNGLENYLKKAVPKNYSELSSCVYKYFGTCFDAGFKIWGDKNNWYLDHIDKIKDIFPNVFFIHIVRDGRDVACSYKELYKKRLKVKYAPNLPNKVGEIAKQWSRNLNTIQNSLKKVKRSKFVEVKYEDLVESPEISLKQLCKKLGIKFDSNMLNFYKLNKKKNLVPKQYMGWKENTYNKLNSTSVGRYNKELTVKERETFERIAEKQLRKYGYLG